MNIKIRVVLADDHDVVRTGIKAMLEKDPNIKVVGEADDGLQAVALVRSLIPNVLIIDNVMKTMNGLEVAKWVSEHEPACKIIMVTMYKEEPYVRRAFRNGVTAYILKDDVQKELPIAIQSVLRDERYWSEGIQDDVLEDLNVVMSTTEDDPLAHLSDREREIFYLMVSGESRPEICDTLSIALKTFDSHRTQIRKKLKVNTDTQLLQFAVLHGLVLNEQLNQ